VLSEEPKGFPLFKSQRSPIHLSTRCLCITGFKTSENITNLKKCASVVFSLFLSISEESKSVSIVPCVFLLYYVPCIFQVLRKEKPEYIMINCNKENVDSVTFIKI